MEQGMNLVRRVRSGERAAFDLLYESLFPRVYTFVARRVGDGKRAEAIVREIFFDLLASLPGISEGESILRHAFTLTLRRLARENEISGHTRGKQGALRTPAEPGVGGRAA
jgi:DNA-directed RNA polymerase specialized sigma24 family protein